MVIGWGVLALVLAGVGIAGAVLPQEDDLGAAILVVSSFVTGIGLAAIVMFVGAMLGLRAVVTDRHARTSGVGAATGGTLLAATGLATYLWWFVFGW
ncbi:hypothetical protein ACOQFB_17145 [Anaeromyxobacter sp. Red801]|uniref:hypothetical protein n=1 Tax=Anaeromyxobacter sp. Red801 TaxID=3411632 RepID=UPI003B9F6FB5